MVKGRLSLNLEPHHDAAALEQIAGFGSLGERRPAGDDPDRASESWIGAVVSFSRVRSKPGADRRWWRGFYHAPADADQCLGLLPARRGCENALCVPVLSR